VVITHAVPAWKGNGRPLSGCARASAS